MFYPNTLNLKEIKYSKKKYATFSNGINTDYDSNLLPVKYSPNTYNFNFLEGALTDGIGVTTPKFRYLIEALEDTKELISPTTYHIEGCWLFPVWVDNRTRYSSFIIIYSAEGKMYYNTLHNQSGEMHLIEDFVLSEKPIVTSYKLNGVDTLIIVNETDGMFTWTLNEGITKIENAPKISSMCVHYERLFVTTFGEKRSIMFSDDLNPVNFNISATEGGFIEMVDDFGRLNKVLSFEGCLYVFRDYNIARVIAYGDQNEFSVSQLYVSNGKIFDQTICICGNKIMYLASDGIYMFNGSSSTRLDLNINKMFKGVTNQYARAGYSNGYYYLACKLNFVDDKMVGCETDDRYSNNALLKIEVSTGKLTILRGYDISDICVINDILDSYVIVTIQTDLGKVLGMLDMSGSILVYLLKRYGTLALVTFLIQKEKS